MEKQIQITERRYNMKKITSLFLMAFLLVGTMAIVAADDYEGTDIPVPEAKKIGFFENQFDRLSMAFTFNKEKKINKILEVAEKHLAEAEALADEDPEAYAKAQEQYDALVQRAEEVLANIENGAEDVNDSEKNLEKIARIEAKFETHRDRIDAMYARALERFAQNNASDEKIARFEMFHNRAINRTNVMENRILERRDIIAKKHKALSELNDTELMDVLYRIDENEGLTQARERRMEHFEERNMRLEQVGEDRIVRIQGKIDTGNLTEEQVAELTQRIGDIRGRIDELDNATPFMRPMKPVLKAKALARIPLAKD